MNRSCERESTRKGRHIILMHSLLWAAVMLSSALIMAGSASDERFGYLLIVVLIPSWFASDQLLRRAIEVK